MQPHAQLQRVLWISFMYVVATGADLETKRTTMDTRLNDKSR